MRVCTAWERRTPDIQQRCVWRTDEASAGTCRQLIIGWPTARVPGVLQADEARASLRLHRRGPVTPSAGPLPFAKERKWCKGRYIVATEGEEPVNEPIRHREGPRHERAVQARRPLAARGRLWLRQALIAWSPRRPVGIARGSGDSARTRLQRLHRGGRGRRLRISVSGPALAAGSWCGAASKSSQVGRLRPFGSHRAGLRPIDAPLRRSITSSHAWTSPCAGYVGRPRPMRSRQNG